MRLLIRNAVSFLFRFGILAIILSASPSARAHIWPGKEWSTATPESQGMSGAALDEAVDHSQRHGGVMKSRPSRARVFIQVLLRPPVCCRPVFASIAPIAPTSLCTSPIRHERDTSPALGGSIRHSAGKPSLPH